MDYEPNFGTNFLNLIKSFGIDVPEIRQTKVGSQDISLKFNNSDREIDEILKSLSQTLSQSELEILEKDGIEINFENEEGCSPLSNDIITTDDGLFYKGRRVLLHIAQQTYKRKTKSTPPEDLHKYHLHYCQSLKEQKAKGNLEKYRVSLSEDGKFHYVFSKENGGVVRNQKLNVCKTCLKDFYKKDDYEKIGVTYNKKKNSLDVSGFKLKDFFDNQPKTVLDGDSPKFLFDGLNISGMDMDYNEVSAEYRDDWREISIARKKAKNYTCEECGWSPKSSKEKKYIHTHHMDKDKSNNLSSNLKVLCIDCHFNYHPTLKGNAEHEKFLEIKN
jgi:hypothetical protein